MVLKILNDADNNFCQYQYWYFHPVPNIFVTDTDTFYWYQRCMIPVPIPPIKVCLACYISSSLFVLQQIFIMITRNLHCVNGLKKEILRRNVSMIWKINFFANEKWKSLQIAKSWDRDLIFTRPAPRLFSATKFLSDPGVPGVRSMGPDVSPSVQD